MTPSRPIDAESPVATAASRSTTTAALPDVTVDLRGVLGTVQSTHRRQIGGIVLLVAGLAIVVTASLALGARDIPPGTVVDALLGRRPAGDVAAQIVLGERLPRTLLGLLVGACLGAAGVLAQAITRNPLVDGSVLGIELGAAFAVVVGIVALGVTTTTAQFWVALVGAAVAAVAVFTLSRLVRGTSTAIGLVLVGAAVSALVGAAINLLLLRDEAAFTRYRFWSIGELAGRGDVLPEVWPFAVVGLALALCCGPTLNALSLGEQAAAGLGVGVGRAQLATGAVTVLLCAAATAACGPVAFVGLVGAHLGRLLVGADHRRLVPYGILCGAVLLVAADVLGRLGPGYGEISVGIMTALIGTPFFIALARTRRLVAA